MTAGSPWRRYGPTVVMSTRVRSAIARIDAASSVSAITTDGRTPPTAAIASVTACSLAGLRPAIAQVAPSGRCVARYFAVSSPVKPVAPSRVMSTEVIDPT